jgi:Zn-dependent metalloprotease
MKKINTITICTSALSLLLLLISCFTAKLAQTPPTEPAPTAVVTATSSDSIIPTASVKFIEQTAYKDTTYAKFIADEQSLNEPIDKHQALQVVIQKAYEQNPIFFDYDVDYTVEYSTEITFKVYLVQISPRGRKTGNSVFALVKMNGAIQSFSIWDHEDPTAIDKDYTISKDKALEIAYKANIEKLKKKIQSNPDIKVNFDERHKHKVEIDFAIHNDTPKWRISIKSPSNAPFIISYCVTIDANTGEVLMCNGYR